MGVALEVVTVRSVVVYWLTIVLLVGAAGAVPVAAQSTEDVSDPTAQRAEALSGSVRIMNYNPPNHGWHEMWTKWNAAEVEADMRRARSLGVTTVRFVIPPATFGYPELRPIMTKRLDIAVTKAWNNGMTSQLTLFDFLDPYSEAEGQVSMRWSESLLSKFAGDERVALIEVRNEIDPYNAQAMVWAREHIAHVHRVMPGTPVTISTSGALGVDGVRALKKALLGEEPDLYSLHYYGRAGTAYSEFVSVKNAVAPVPLIVGEAGYSTAAGKWRSTSAAGRETEQDAWYRTVMAAAAVAGLAPVAPWTLFDSTASGIPFDGWDRAEYEYGLFRIDRSAKPAAYTVRSAFRGHRMPELFNVDFKLRVRGTDDPAQWVPWMKSGAMSIVKSGGRNGANAVMIAGSSSQPDGVTAYMTSPSQPLREGWRWEYSVWARGESHSGISDMTLAWFDGNGQWLGNSSSEPVAPGDTGWTRFSGAGVPPSEARYAEVHLRSGGNAGAVYFSTPRWSTAEFG